MKLFLLKMFGSNVVQAETMHLEKDFVAMPQNYLKL